MRWFLSKLVFLVLFSHGSLFLSIVSGSGREITDIMGPICLKIIIIIIRPIISIHLVSGWTVPLAKKKKKCEVVSILAIHQH